MIDADDRPAPQAPPAAYGPTRKDAQLGRRLVHVANGVAIATAYGILFTHRQVVHLFGTLACLVYILDRIRIHYPELASRAPWLRDLFFRAEEQIEESAMVPYVIAILLTLLTFPKAVALIAIYTLAIADPLSALVGITWGRRHLVAEKTVEGSCTFLAAALAVSTAVLHASTSAPLDHVLSASLLIALCATAVEMLPLRIDDNLTIPLAAGFAGWISCALFGIPVS